MHKQLQTNMGLMLVPKAGTHQPGRTHLIRGWGADGTSVVSCSPSFDVPAKCMAALIGVITVIIRGPNDPGRHRACSSQSRQTMLL